MNVSPLIDPDRDHERAIERARIELLKHWTPEKWGTLIMLIQGRSERQVERMERELGIGNR